MGACVSINADRDEQHRGDLLIRVSERQQEEDVALPFRDRLSELSGIRDDDITAQLGTDVARACSHPADGVEQVGVGGPLGEVTGCA